MSMIPRSSSVFDPFSIDPFEGMGFPFFHNSGSGGTRWTSGEIFAISGTRVDWKETPEAHVIKADLPGMKKEEVKVDVDGARVLRISGERKKEQEEEEKTDTWHRLERPRGKFIRSFRLPANAKVDQVSASMENGVLTVTVPKVEVKKPEVKSIDISG